MRMLHECETASRVHNAPQKLTRAYEEAVV